MACKYCESNKFFCSKYYRVSFFRKCCLHKCLNFFGGNFFSLLFKKKTGSCVLKPLKWLSLAQYYPVIFSSNSFHETNEGLQINDLVTYFWTESITLHKKSPFRNYSGLHFSRIFPHPDWIRSISPYSVRMRENPRKMRTRITPNTDSFYAVVVNSFLNKFYCTTKFVEKFSLYDLWQFNSILSSIIF